MYLSLQISHKSTPGNSQYKIIVVFVQCLFNITQSVELCCNHFWKMVKKSYQLFFRICLAQNIQRQGINSTLL